MKSRSIYGPSAMQLTLFAVLILRLCSLSFALPAPSPMIKSMVNKPCVELGVDAITVHDILESGAQQIQFSWYAYLNMLDKAEECVRVGYWPSPAFPSYMKEAQQAHSYQQTLFSFITMAKKKSEEVNEKEKKMLIALIRRLSRLHGEYSRYLHELISEEWNGRLLGEEQQRIAMLWLYQQRANILTKAEVKGEDYVTYMRGHGLIYITPDDPNKPLRHGPVFGRPQSSVSEMSKLSAGTSQLGRATPPSRYLSKSKPEPGYNVEKSGKRTEEIGEEEEPQFRPHKSAPFPHQMESHPDHDYPLPQQMPQFHQSGPQAMDDPTHLSHVMQGLNLYGAASASNSTSHLPHQLGSQPFHGYQLPQQVPQIYQSGPQFVYDPTYPPPYPYGQASSSYDYYDGQPMQENHHFIHPQRYEHFADQTSPAAAPKDTPTLDHETGAHGAEYGTWDVLKDSHPFF